MTVPPSAAPGRGEPVDTIDWPPDAVEVGRIVGAWGVQGGIKLKPFSADPQALFSSKRWYLSAPAPAQAPPGVAAAQGAAWPRLLRVVQARSQGEHVVARVHDVDDRTAAEALKGAAVWVSRASFPTPEEGEYYWVDLIGLSVVDRAGRELGRVDGLIETGPHCVLSVIGTTDAGVPRAPVLIPFVDAYVDRVDRAAGRIHVDWPTDDDDAGGGAGA